MGARFLEVFLKSLKMLYQCLQDYGLSKAGVSATTERLAIASGTPTPHFKNLKAADFWYKGAG
jgi:hypothetical protein